MRIAPGLVLGFVVLGGAQGAAAQQGGASPACRQESLRGRVTSGESYAAPLSRGLVFRLDADTLEANPPGWTLRVTAEDAPGTDFAMVATPPYRFANPRYVDTGYGISAEQALANSPREFAFVASTADYARASAALEVLLWAYGFTDAQVTSANDALESLTTYPATFIIEDGEASAPTDARPGGRIEWLAFRLDACVPAS
jgi:hypothetical protein